MVLLTLLEKVFLENHNLKFYKLCVILLVNIKAKAVCTMSNNSVFKAMQNILSKMKEHPENVSEKERSILKKIYFDLCKSLDFSEHSAWAVKWTIDKWNSIEDKLAGIAPYETVTDNQNIILDTGANEILKLISGTGGTAYSSTNTKMFVGTSTTPENASQTGVQASGDNRAFASLDSGYPVVEGRTINYRATFGDSSANFQWNEVSVTNGDGANAVSMNRKVSSMGTKNGGVWTVQVTISVVSN